MSYILLMQKGVPHLLDEKDYKDEEKLQNLLEESPMLIPIKDIDMNASPLLVIGKEVGGIDLLAVDENGLLTIIETKLIENQEQYREVIGQIFEYAGMLAEWSNKNIVEIADKYLMEKKGNTLREQVEEIHKNTENGWTYEKFEDNLGDNLRKGNFRLLIVGNKINDKLKRTVKYINEHLEDCSIYCVEVKNFEEGEQKVLVPTLIGFGKVEKRTDGKKREWWKEESFLQFVDEKSKIEEDDKRVIKELYEFTSKEVEITSFGTGVEWASFHFKCKSKAGLNTLFTLGVGEGYWGLHFPFINLLKKIDEKLVRDFAEKLKKLGVEEIKMEKIKGRGEGSSVYCYNLTFLKEKEKIEQFKEIIIWMKKQVEES